MTIRAFLMSSSGSSGQLAGAVVVVGSSLRVHADGGGRKTGRDDEEAAGEVFCPAVVRRERLPGDRRRPSPWSCRRRSQFQHAA